MIIVEKEKLLKGFEAIIQFCKLYEILNVSCEFYSRDKTETWICLSAKYCYKEIVEITIKLPGEIATAMILYLAFKDNSEELEKFLGFYDIYKTIGNKFWQHISIEALSKIKDELSQDGSKYVIIHAVNEDSPVMFQAINK